MRPGLAAVATGLVAALTLAALAITNGSPAAVVAPVAAAALLYVVWNAPLRACVLGTMFLTLVAEVPQDNPMNGVWHSPLYELGRILCTNWSKTFGVPGLGFSGLDLLCILLTARIVIEGAPARLPSLSRLSFAAFYAALCGLFALGALRGGDLNAAYWQVRQLACVPLFAWFLAQALHDEADQVLLARLVVTAAVVKALVGTYFYVAIVRPQGLVVPVVVSHAETMLFVLALILLCVRWLERPDWRATVRGTALGLVVLTGMFLNNRRIAYAGLAGSLAIVWQLARPNAAKRAAARLAILCVPLVAVWFAVGWRSDAAIFKPVAAVRTMVGTEEATEAQSASASSTKWRKMENFNLSRTLRSHPLGTGFGHEYEEFIKAPDISHDFKLYRFIPHNSVFWLMMVGGPVGFFLLLLPFAAGTFLAMRAHRHARSAVQRMAAVAAACAVFLFLVQTYGDMGSQTWSTTWLVAAALAVAARCAIATGAIDAPIQPSEEAAWNLSR